MSSWNWEYKQRCFDAGIPGLISEVFYKFNIRTLHCYINSFKLRVFLEWYKLHCIKSMKACPRSSHHSAEWKFHPGLFLHWCSFSDWSANYGALLFKNRTKIISRQTSVRPVSEYLTPGTKTVIEYDCMPSFANILLASITDIDKNRIVESFGIKKGIKLENNF